MGFVQFFETAKYICVKVLYPIYIFCAIVSVLGGIASISRNLNIVVKELIEIKTLLIKTESNNLSQNNGVGIQK